MKVVQVVSQGLGACLVSLTTAVSFTWLASRTKGRWPFKDLLLELIGHVLQLINDCTVNNPISTLCIDAGSNMHRIWH